MNKVILIGRLTRDPEVRYSQGAQQTAICTYTLAVNRSYKRDGDPDADFFDSVVFGRIGEAAGRYLHKGSLVAVVGEVRNESWTDKNGNKRWSTKVYVSEQQFLDPKQDSGNRSNDFAPTNEEAPRQWTPAPGQAPAQQYAYQQQDMYSPGDYGSDYGESDEDLPF